MYHKLYRLYLDFDSNNKSPSGFITLRCPFHDDKKPSAGFSDKTGVFNCHSCGCVSTIDFLTKIANVEKEEAYRILDDFRRSEELIDFPDFKITGPPVTSVKFKELYKLSQVYFEAEEPIVQKYCESRGLTVQTLIDREVGLLPAHLTSWGRQVLVFPYLLSGEVVGLKYRDSNSNKHNEEGSYMTLWGVDRVEETENGTIVLVEGESDCLLAHQILSPLGLTVVGAPSARFESSWVREFEGINQLILVSHCDDAAQKMVTSAHSHMSGDVTHVELPWAKRQYGKDICDWVRTNSEQDFADLINGAVKRARNRMLTSKELVEFSGENDPWLIKGLLARRQAAVIVGQPKSYKTWLVLNLVKCLREEGSYFCDIPEFQSVVSDINVLFIEEEGNLGELKERAKMALNGSNWEKGLYWGHRLGIRLDDYNSVKRLERMIIKGDIDVLILDPMQKLHALDENDASDMGKVWMAISGLLNKFPKLSIVILMHSRKGGNVLDGWTAIRGSSRHAAEADLGIFVEKRAYGEAKGARVTIDGRSIPTVTPPDGKDYFKLFFEDGKLSMDTSQVFVSKHQALDLEIRSKGTWDLGECAMHFGTSTMTIRRWVEKLSHLTINRNSENRGSTIVCDFALIPKES